MVTGRLFASGAAFRVAFQLVIVLATVEASRSDHPILSLVLLGSAPAFALLLRAVAERFRWLMTSVGFVAALRLCTVVAAAFVITTSPLALAVLRPFMVGAISVSMVVFPHRLTGTRATGQDESILGSFQSAMIVAGLAASVMYDLLVRVASGPSVVLAVAIFIAAIAFPAERHDETMERSTAVDDDQGLDVVWVGGQALLSFARSVIGGSALFLLPQLAERSGVGQLGLLFALISLAGVAGRLGARFVKDQSLIRLIPVLAVAAGSLAVASLRSGVVWLPAAMVVLGGAAGLLEVGQMASITRTKQQVRRKLNLVLIGFDAGMLVAAVIASFIGGSLWLLSLVGCTAMAVGATGVLAGERAARAKEPEPVEQ